MARRREDVVTTVTVADRVVVHSGIAYTYLNRYVEQSWGKPRAILSAPPAELMAVRRALADTALALDEYLEELAR